MLRSSTSKLGQVQPVASHVSMVLQDGMSGDCMYWKGEVRTFYVARYAELH